MAKKPDKPYKPPTVRAPRRESVPQNEHQCMWGCGYFVGEHEHHPEPRSRVREQAGIAAPG